MLLQDEQYIIKWLSQYGTLTKTQVIRLLKDKPVSTAEKIIRNLKRDITWRWTRCASLIRD